MLTAPAAGANLLRGVPVTISWVGNGATDPEGVTVGYYGSFGGLNLIADHQPTTGSLTWIVPACWSGPLTFGTVFSGCNTSYVSPSVEPTPAVRLTAPAAGANLLRGVPVTISWVGNGATDPEGVSVGYYGSFGGLNLIADHQPTTGSLTWIVPACWSGPLTFGTVFSGCNTSYVSPSVEPTPAAPVRLLWPDGGELFLAGGMTPVTWAATAPISSTITIEYQLAEQTSWITIPTVPADAMTALWNLPAVTSTTPLRIRLTATNACTGQPGAVVSDDFSILPTVNDNNPCTADIIAPIHSQILHPGHCALCSDQVPCLIPDWECHDGICRPKPGLCPPKDCKFVYRYLSQCYQIDICTTQECCIEGRCVPRPEGQECAPPSPDELLRDFFIDVAFEFVNAGIGNLGEVLNLSPTTSLPAFTYTMFRVPTGSRFISFEHRSSGLSPGQQFSMNFGSQPLFLLPAPAVSLPPPGEWVREMVYVGDLVGVRGPLTVLLTPPPTLAPNPQFSLRNFRIYGAGHPYCPGDFNDSGAVTVQDIFDFLTPWFAHASRADFNGVGGVTIQDIFDFLAAYFAGC